MCVCQARLCTLFPGCSVQFVGVSTDYEAALNLVDIVDAYDGRHGVVLCNVARREGSERKSKWPNGPVYVHTHTHTHTHICICVYICTCICVCVCVCVYKSKWLNGPVYINIYIHVYIQYKSKWLNGPA
jgi:hypothetical protein